MRKKTNSFIILCLLFQMAGLTGFSAPDAISVSKAEILYLQAVIEGTVNRSEALYVTLTVAKNNTPVETAAPEDLIYMESLKTKEDGTFRFAFPVYELRGRFAWRLTCVAAGGEKTGELVYQPTGDNVIHAFTIGGKAAQLSGNQIQVTLGKDANLTGLIAEFNVHENALCYVNGVLQTSGVTRNNFTNPVDYRVVADDKTEKTYRVTVAKEQGDNGGGGIGGGAGGGSSFTAPPKTTGPEPAQKPGYFDVPQEHYAYSAIQALSEKEILSGFPDGSFRPDYPVKREEFVKIAALAFRLEIRGTKVFSDVSPADWYAAYIDKGYSNGLINGISEAEFGTGNNITREDMVTMLYRYLKNNGKIPAPVKENKEFTDQSEISAYAQDGISALYQGGILNGFDDGSFGPKHSATRGEVSLMIQKLLSE